MAGEVRETTRGNNIAPIHCETLTMNFPLTKIFATLAMMPMFAACLPAQAALDIGEPAPKFSAPAALDGKPFTYSLAAELAKGPVVVYFFPAAFSTGCSIEAHAFAEAIDQFKALGTTVIGVSTDDMETLSKFSSQTCQGKFPVASDANKDISKGFDALMQLRPDYANRISYVVAPNGTVAYFYQSLNPFKHVEKMLTAVKELPQNRDKK
jgi:thioredoxin-dependent peroxiredoxin